MITQKVTLVLGAGASNPYGFPLGEKIKDEVIKQATSPDSYRIGDTSLPSLLKPFGFSNNDVQEFALQLKNSAQPSIDAFLFERVEFIEIGKLAIAANLIQHEHIYGLIGEGADNTKKWYDYLLNNFMGTREEFKSNNLSIITFNYDRSFEYFFYYTLKPRFNLSVEEVVDYIRSIPIVHILWSTRETALF